MTAKPWKITESVLHAYVDGVLDEEHRGEVEAYLAANPGEAERIKDYQRQNEALQEFAKAMMDEPYPGTWRHRPSRLRLPLRRLAIAASWLLLGGLGGWTLNEIAATRQPPVFPLQHQAAAAHEVFTPEVRHPVEVRANEEKHLYAWLSKRLGSRIVPPRIDPMGFALVGGRLLASQSGPAAQLMFEDAKGLRITLYVRASPEPPRHTGLQFDRRGRVSIAYWFDGPMEIALSGELEKPELLGIAEVIRRQM